ncbi:aldo/keto reductase [Microbacterium sp. CGR1]|uniref:oxidoreductase n=1 Tax=Microbacterium sp. CGR1 TaxID=1696072 RepID=UPI00069E04A2|nr:oxidoreductase [Microbacterium sp. CGR1]AKV86541.1 aldo/keto reductase [Microbacterium sp. CGR1]
MTPTNAKNTFRLGGDLPVGRIGFGAMRLAANGFTGPAREPEAGIAVLRRAVELGVNHIDTAAFYASQDSSVRANDLIREALHPYLDGLMIATKVGPEVVPGGGVRMTKDPQALRAMVEDNLSGLGLDALDLVYLRVGGGMGPDGEESVAARFEALEAMRQEGLIRHLGLSNITPVHLAEAQAIATVAAVQNHFHAAQRDDLDLLHACEAAGIAFVPYFPLGGGMTDLGGELITQVAQRHEATIPQIALAWLLATSPVTLAIPGTGSIAHLEENMAAADIHLTDDDLAQLA